MVLTFEQLNTLQHKLNVTPLIIENNDTNGYARVIVNDNGKEHVIGTYVLPSHGGYGTFEEWLSKLTN